MTWIASLRALSTSRRLGAATAGLSLAALLAAGIVAVGTRRGERPEGDVVPAALTLSGDGTELRLDGDLMDGTARRIRRLLRAQAGVRVLSLRSEGGLVDEAEQIGDIVSAYGLATFAPDTCVSACTLVFVRGRERLAVPDVQLGFHAPYDAGISGEQVPVPSDEERQAYVAAGIAPDFVDRALSTPSAEIWFPERDHLLRARVVSAFVQPAELAARVAGYRSEFAAMATPNE